MSKYLNVKPFSLGFKHSSILMHNKLVQQQHLNSRKVGKTSVWSYSNLSFTWAEYSWYTEELKKVVQLAKLCSSINIISEQLQILQLSIDCIHTSIWSICTEDLNLHSKKKIKIQYNIRLQIKCKTKGTTHTGLISSIATLC